MNDLSEKFFGILNYATKNKINYHFQKNEKGKQVLLLGLNWIIYGDSLEDTVSKAHSTLFEDGDTEGIWDHKITIESSEIDIEDIL